MSPGCSRLWLGSLSFLVLPDKPPGATRRIKRFASAFREGTGNRCVPKVVGGRRMGAGVGGDAGMRSLMVMSVLLG